MAIEAVTHTRIGNANGGGLRTTSQMAYITLDASAAAGDDVYNGMVVRITAGAGQYDIFEIMDYRGSDKRAWIRGNWSVVPDNSTTTFRICQGMVFDKQPNEVGKICRAFFDISSDAPGGSPRDFYQKIFIRNNHSGGLALTNAQIVEQADPSTKLEFGIEGSLNGSGTTTNRLTAPGGVTFNSSTKPVFGGSHLALSAQGVWLHLALAAGDAALDTVYALREEGAST